MYKYDLVATSFLVELGYFIELIVNFPIKKGQIPDIEWPKILIVVLILVKAVKVDNFHPTAPLRLTL